MKFGLKQKRFNVCWCCFLTVVGKIIKSIICLIAVITPPLSIYFLVFIGAAFTTSLLGISRLTMIAEICNEEDRPTYVALTNMITSPFVLLGIGGGWLANRFGYQIVFVIAGIFALIASIWYYKMVEEPRQRGAAVNI